MGFFPWLCFSDADWQTKSDHTVVSPLQALKQKTLRHSVAYILTFQLHNKCPSVQKDLHCTSHDFLCHVFLLHVTLVSTSQLGVNNYCNLHLVITQDSHRSIKSSSEELLDLSAGHNLGWSQRRKLYPGFAS